MVATATHLLYGCIDSQGCFGKVYTYVLIPVCFKTTSQTEMFVLASDLAAKGRSDMTARWDGIVPVANSTTPAVNGNAMHRSECQAENMSSRVRARIARVTTVCSVRLLIED